MTLSKRSADTLLDLVEIKLSCMEVWDRDDRREARQLEQARSELVSLMSRLGPTRGRGAASPRAIADSMPAEDVAA